MSCPGGELSRVGRSLGWLESAQKWAGGGKRLPRPGLKGSPPGIEAKSRVGVLLGRGVVAQDAAVSRALR